MSAPQHSTHGPVRHATTITPDLHAAIISMPKAELHLHIEGTLEPQLAMQLAERNRITLPWQSLDELRAEYNFSNLQSFLDLYYQLMAVLRTQEDFRDLMLAYLERAAHDGVRRAEIFFDPQVHMNNGTDLDIVMDGLLEGLRLGRERWGVDGALIMCILRDQPVESAEALLDAAEHRIHDLLGIGLDSAEVGYPPRLFSNVYARARALGLHVVAHAGEEGPAEYVHEALDILRVERIDHGNHAADDPTLVTRLATEGIPFTMCPLSNRRLQVVEDLHDLPTLHLLNAGIRVTINSDDPAYFGGYIGDNYEALASIGLTLEQLAQCARNSFEAAFLTDEKRKPLIDALDAWERDNLM